jgi:hypothetical protein
VGADSEPELGERSSDQRNDTTARQGSVRDDDDSGNLQSDRLGSMAGSQATAGLRGGASRQRATHHQRAHKARTRPRLEGRAPQQEKASVLTSRSGRDDEVVERAAWNGLEQGK